MDCWNPCRDWGIGLFIGEKVRKENIMKFQTIALLLLGAGIAYLGWNYVNLRKFVLMNKEEKRQYLLKKYPTWTEEKINEVLTKVSQ